MTEDQIKNLSGCEKLSEVRQLNLSNAGIVELDSKILQQLTSLEELNLSKNKLSKLELRDLTIVPTLKVLDVSQNQLNCIDGLISFPNLESLVLSDNTKLEVADKYKVVSFLPKLKLLDGKDVSQMKDAVTRLDTILLAKVEEVWSKHFSTKWKKDEESAREKAVQIEEEFLSKLKAEVTCGPVMLKPYREYKLTNLGKEKIRNLKELMKERVREDEPLTKKQKVIAVNGDANADENKFAVKNEDIENKEHQTIQKKELIKNILRNNKKEKRKERCLSESEFLVSHLLQTHSLNNDPADRKTQVWGCAFEPDADMPGHTTDICATCGGDSVCFIDCSTGRVMKKYKQPGETFYCLAWTTVTLDFGNGNLKRTNLIAAGGVQKDIKIIEPTQLVCFEEIKGHKGVLELLLFHPLQPTWLMSSADDNTVVVWDLGLPKGADQQTVKSKQLLTLKSKSIVRYFDVPPHGLTLVGGCDDGCFLWRLTDLESTKDKTRSNFGKLEFPTKKNKFVPLDCVKCISDNRLATKRVEEGTILLWHSESNMLKNDMRPTHALQWRLTETPFLKFSYSSGCDVLLAGDDSGCVWLYDVEQLLSDAEEKKQIKVRTVECTKVLACPNETTKVFNQVATCSSMNYIVAVADSNVVCIWRRVPNILGCV